MKNKITKLDHVNFTVTNFKESVSWYQKIFNFNLVESEISNGVRWGILKSGEAMLALTEYSERKFYRDDPAVHRIGHFGFQLIDKDEWAEKLEKFNLETFYSSPVHYPNSTSWYIKDPNGHLIEVSIWKNNQVQFADGGE